MYLAVPFLSEKLSGEATNMQAKLNSPWFGSSFCQLQMTLFSFVLFCFVFLSQIKFCEISVKCLSLQQTFHLMYSPK